MGPRDALTHTFPELRWESHLTTPDCFFYVGSRGRAQVLMFLEGALEITLPPNSVHMSVIMCIGTHTCMWSPEVSTSFLSHGLSWNSQRWARLASQPSLQILLSPPSLHWN